MYLIENQILYFWKPSAFSKDQKRQVQIYQVNKPILAIAQGKGGHAAYNGMKMNPWKPAVAKIKNLITMNNTMSLRQRQLVILRVDIHKYIAGT